MDTPGRPGLDRPIGVVRYHFHAEGWSGAPWHVLEIHLVEAISEVYRLTVDLVVVDTTSAISPLLGASCTLTVGRDGSERDVHGLILQLDDLGGMGGRRRIRVHIGPALALLGQRVDTRAWQDRTVPEIVQEVLSEALAPHGREVRVEVQGGDYLRREYCVQLRESDLEFVARLCEVAGISFYFDHGGATETIVLIDHAAAAPLLSAVGGSDEVPIVENQIETASSESLHSIAWSERLCSTSVVTRDFDFTEPGNPTYESRSADARGHEREVYLHGEQVFVTDGARRADIRREALAYGHRVASGSSNVTLLRPGVRLRIGGHHRSDLASAFLVTRVVHRGSCPEEVIEIANAGAARYANELECVPESVPLRPRLTRARPRMYGPLTAVVTGPSGEEVHTDEYGRIKVLMPWDRHAPEPVDETTSWWVRVAQGWSGPGYGSLFLPRIGMEVVVEFLDGDPDRPLVTGCVYNGRNMPPYTLPDDKTKSTIQTRSSPGGDGYNELRFEDQRGGEEVYLQAERDWNSVVKRNKTLKVLHNEHDMVLMNRAVEVGMNDALTVGMNRAETVMMNRAVTVVLNQKELVKRNASRTIGERYEVDVGASMGETIGESKSEHITEYKSVSTGRSSSEDVGEDKTLYIARDATETVGSEKSVDVGKNLMISAGESASLSSGARMTFSAGDDLTVVGEKKGLIVIEEQLVIRVGEAAIVLKKNGDILLSGAKISITGSGDIKIKGANVAAN